MRWFRRRKTEAPQPVTNLKRALVSAKIVWEISKSTDIVSQNIVVKRNNEIIIDKELSPTTNTFSFATGKSHCVVEISPFNGYLYCEPTVIEFDIE